MHIPDGILPVAVAAGGYVAAGATMWYSLRQIDKLDEPRQHIPKAALLTATFFVSSLIYIPVPPTSIHLLLSGLMGAVLGYFAFPAIFIGLLFQAIIFGHGGLTTLGVNALILGLPALLAHLIFQLRGRLNLQDSETMTAVFGFLAGAIGVTFAVLTFFTILITTIPADMDVAAEQGAIIAMTLAHLPLVIVEGAITAMLVTFLKRVKPELLRGMREVPVG